MVVEDGAFCTEYFMFGEGKIPLVIIPGVSVRSVMGAAGAVEAQYARFCKTHTVYVFDRRTGISEGTGVSDMAEDLARAMRLLGIFGADVFGASQGGMIALVLAAEHPDLVSRLVISSSLLRQNEVSRDTFSRWVSLALAGDVRALNHAVNTRVYSSAYYARYRDAFARIETEGGDGEVARFRILAAACLSFDGTEYAPRVRCPALVFGAEEDRVLSSVGTREIADALGCPSRILAGYGHALYDECPDFPAMLAAFFGEGR